MLEKKVRNKKMQMSDFNTEAKTGSDDEESDGSEKEYGNRKHSTLTCQGKFKHSTKAWNGLPQSIDCKDLVGGCNKVAAIITIKVGRVQSATSLHSNDPIMEIENHADTTMLGSNCRPIHDFGTPVDISGWDPSAGSVECPTIYGSIEYDHLGRPPSNVNKSLDVPNADSDGGSHN